MDVRSSSTIVVALLVLAAAQSHATTVIRISLDQMTVGSTLVLHGTVAASTPVAVNGNKRHIRTHVTVKIHSLLKGPRGMRTITLELAGGRLGKWAMMIPGMPTFTAGEEVVLFLEKTKLNWALTGLSQGKFTVTTESDGRKVVKRRMDGLHFMAYDPKGKLRPVKAPGEVKQSLNSLLSQVRQIIKAAPGTK